MNFPGKILDRISRLFEDGTDDILIYVAVFLFVFLAGQQNNREEEEDRSEDGGLPIVLIAIFVIFFLFKGNKRELIDLK